MAVHVIDHPLAQHYLTQLRDQNTKPTLFRSLTRKLTNCLAVEATRRLHLEPITIDTPLERIESPLLADKIVVVPILRAGLGMLDSIVDLLPEVSVGYVGLERDEVTAVASSYYYKVPIVAGRTIILLDPMLATGGSASRALDDLYSLEPARVALICIVAAPEGIALLTDSYPELDIYTAAIDRELNAKKYILPGLGDFGDRLYGTF